MQQALALLQWAHKFGPDKHVQRAERFLCERMRLMTTVRSQTCHLNALTLHALHCARQRSDLPQVKGNHRSFEVDIIYECWAVADRLSLHSVAGHCEWALAKMWGERSVYARASMLSPGAVHRIARSLCIGLDASCEGLQAVLSVPLPLGNVGPSQMKKKLREVTEASNDLTNTGTAAAMVRWRMSEAE